MTIAAIALGANLGNRRETLNAAIERISNLGSIIEVSSLYETDPVGYLDQPAFYNAALLLETDLDPESIMGELLKVETELGRVRTFANAPRAIDLDLLLYGNEILDTAALTLPHPRMQERAFVLVPLAEIAPAMIHPLLNTSIAELVESLPEDESIRITFPGVDVPG